MDKARGEGAISQEIKPEEMIEQKDEERGGEIEQRKGGKIRSGGIEKGIIEEKEEKKRKRDGEPCPFRGSPPFFSPKNIKAK